jgi:hypothetical protein
MNNTRDVLREALIRIHLRSGTPNLNLSDLIKILEAPCLPQSQPTPQSSSLESTSSHLPSSQRSHTTSDVREDTKQDTNSESMKNTTESDPNATDPLATAQALMAERGVEVIDLTNLGCGYRVKKREGYWHQREKRHYDEWPNATEFDSESAAILAWLEAEKEKQHDPYIRSAYTRQLRSLIAAIRPAAEVKRSNFVPLETETHLHDMLVGPCKCGAWHEAEQTASSSESVTPCKEDIQRMLQKSIQTKQPAAKPQPAGYSVDDERILVQWRDADGYDHSITIDADEAVYRIDADGIHEFIREWPLPKQPAELKISVRKDFSAAPDARYEGQGKWSAESFRQQLLVPKLKQAIASGTALTVDLDGTAGYAACFLEEAFGGLIRVEGFTTDELASVLHVVSEEEPGLIDEIEKYMNEAQLRVRPKQPADDEAEQAADTTEFQKHIDTVYANVRRTYYIDLDGTIIDSRTEEPLEGAVEWVNQKFDEGHKIVLTTRRGDEEWPATSRYSNLNTARLLKKIGVQFHQIVYNSPSPRILINDEQAFVCRREPNESWGENPIVL